MERKKNDTKKRFASECAGVALKTSVRPHVNGLNAHKCAEIMILLNRQTFINNKHICNVKVMQATSK